MIDLIFFDFDGVLVESVDIKTAAFEKLFEHEAAEIIGRVVEYHVQNAGVSRFEKIRHIYKNILNRPLSEDEFEHRCNRFAQLVVDAVVSAPYVDGALEFIEEYSGAYRLFVVSATPEGEIREIVKKRGIASRFQAVYGAPAQKTDIVKDIIPANGVVPSQCVYVGDAISDYEAACANGVKFVARVHRSNAGLFDSFDCIKIYDLRELKLMIESIEREG